MRSLDLDVVICVCDALEEVKRCLASVVSAGGSNVIISDDGSGQATQRWLEDWVVDHGATLVRSERSQGYTRAANRGLQATSAEQVVFLNSDTVVPQDWVGRVAQVFAQSERVGLVGPLSNAATWQSVPQRFRQPSAWSDGRWMTPDRLQEVDALVQAESGQVFPTVPLLNGFCLAVSRPVIDAIGGFDEQAFPRGYGEENDYCIRAAAAGFEARVADHLFVYHAKSRSYGHWRRRWLSRQGGRALHRRYGFEQVAALTAELSSNETLADLRARVGAALNMEPT